MIVLREFIIATLMEFAKTKLVVLHAHALNYIAMLVTKLVINAKEMGYTSSHRLYDIGYIIWPIKSNGLESARELYEPKIGPYCSVQDARRTKFEGVWNSESACYDIDECELKLHDCHKDAKAQFLIILSIPYGLYQVIPTN